MGAMCGTVCFGLYGVILLIVIIGDWKIFEKAGKPGWASIVPIYNAIVLLEVVGKPIWWILLLLIPLVNVVVAILICIELAKSFGKDAGYGIGLAFLPFIFFPILDFGGARYIGPGGRPIGDSRADDEYDEV